MCLRRSSYCLKEENLLFVGTCSKLAQSVKWLSPYLTLKSTEIVSETNDSEFLNFEPLKYNPSDNNQEILLDEACDPGSNFELAGRSKEKC